MATMSSMGVIMKGAADCRGIAQDRLSLKDVDLGTMYSEQNSLCMGCDETQYIGQHWRRLSNMEAGNVQVYKQLYL